MPVTGSQKSPLCSAARDFLAADSPRVAVLESPSESLLARMRRDVLEGLADPRSRAIPPIYFYDAKGSALYEAITALPEYYLTRKEAALLRQVAPLLADTLPVTELVELGSGSSTKTRILLDAFREGDRPLTYIPIDVSRDFLRSVAEALVEEYPGLRVLGIAAPFEDALALLPPAEGRLFLFLGSTLGNFSPPQQEAFFFQLRQAMRPGNYLLLGFDLRAHGRKQGSFIRAAYDDPQGVTARFNLNLLERLNRELGADFALRHWRHQALYAESEHQIEMHLVSVRPQTVHVAGEAFRFEAGEGILTEISRKFDPEELAAWFSRRGFVTSAGWQDAEETYGLMLLRREGG